jgi:tRNA-5-methyluridine54 2-sulfurtransferase
MAVGNRHLGYKEALNEIEVKSPGSKAAFFAGFQARVAPLIATASDEIKANLVRCSSCGSPTGVPHDDDLQPVCGFCRLAAKARAHEPVALVAPRRKTARR